MAARLDGPGMIRMSQRVRAKIFSLIVARGFRYWGKGAIAVPPLRINGEQWISVGPHVYLGAGCWLNAQPPKAVTGVILTIGDGCSFAGECVVSAVSSVTIGCEVLVARNVYIADHDHAYLGTEHAILHQGTANVAPVVIGDGAWLGQNVVVTSGVRIGRGAVVGANSVITKDVPDYSLAVGSPARVVKSWSQAQDACPPA